MLFCACVGRSPEHAPSGAHPSRPATVEPAGVESAHAAPDAGSTTAAPEAGPPSVLRRVASIPLQLVPGNPRLLVGDRQVYEWRDGGIVAKPRLLAEAFSQQDLQQQAGQRSQLQGRYPDGLYVQVMRARAGEAGWRRRLMRWSNGRWQRLGGPMTDSRGAIAVLEPERGTLAVGCVSGRCFFQPLSGTPIVPRFAWQAACGTRMSAVLGAAIDVAGGIHVLGNECATGRVLLESWQKGETKSSVEVLAGVTPRPEGHDALDIGLGFFDDEAWVWGVEWFWGGGPVTQRLLTHRAGGAWPLVELPCDSVVTDFGIWRGYQVASCNQLLMRPPGAGWSVVVADTSAELQLFDDRLLLRTGDGLWQFSPPGIDAPPLTFELPCAGFSIDLGIAKDFGLAKKLVRPLGDLRKEMVLAALGDQDKTFLIAPDETSARSAAQALGLHSEPRCSGDEFQTFETAD